MNRAHKNTKLKTCLPSNTQSIICIQKADCFGRVVCSKYIIFTFISLIFGRAVFGRVTHLYGIVGRCNVCLPYFIRLNTDISENGFCNLTILQS